MAIEIPQIYIAIIDNIAPVNLRQFAICRTREQILSGGFVHIFDKVKSLENCARIMWYEVFKYAKAARCSHVLFIQYDGWVLNGTLWDPKWLQYDYIGAPWPWLSREKNVGNGGFSLRSIKLLEFLATNSLAFPVRHPEDAVLCQNYRFPLENVGFKWAPTEVARKFSFEREDQHPTFGFHGIFNIPKVLEPDTSAWWKSQANDYIKGKVEWQEIA